MTTTTSPAPINALKTQVVSLMGSGPLATQLIFEVRQVQAELNDVPDNFDEIEKRLPPHAFADFLERILTLVPIALRKIKSEKSPFGRTVIAWQAAVGVVFFFKEGPEQVFNRPPAAIDGILKKKTSHARKRWNDDRNATRSRPTQRLSLEKMVSKQHNRPSAKKTKSQPPSRANRNGGDSQPKDVSHEASSVLTPGGKLRKSS